jgi:hypothetical protein
MAQELTTTDPSGGTKTPVILAWIVPGAWIGRDWVTTSETELDEHDPTPGDRLYWEGSYDRIRHKLRHIQPGNIVASSAQGSDLVLDEGVTLANRRGNEIRLRDQDQAFVLRSLQQFHAMAGARVYAGMVQRDATFLPTTMVSDGKDWDGRKQSSLGVPLNERVLSPEEGISAGYLTPALNLHKSPTETASEGAMGRSFLAEDPYLDPYRFLRHGGFITESGFAIDGRHQADAVYGAKPIFRVSSQSRDNAVLDAGASTLTEYRIEVAHTSDGRLPVTEQTDMFDAERLPGEEQTAKGREIPPGMPFIEWVLGSVVGNDPFSPDGRKQYGMPLKAVIFDGNTPNPRLEPAKIALAGSGASPTPLAEQAASLFRVSPPLGDTSGTFWSVNKGGQLRAFIGGDPKGNSVEAYLAGGLKLGFGGKFQMLMNGHLELGTTSKSSMSLTASEGAVRIYGGGPPQTQEMQIESQLGTGRGSGDVPSVDIEARTNARLKAEKKVLIKGNEVELNASSVRVLGHEEVSLDGVRRTSISTEKFQLAVNGQAQESYSGPKYLLPTNFPLHERTYAPMMPGFVCERVTFVAGDREEQFRLGNHKTTVLIGNMTYETLLGQWQARAVTSQITMGVTGISGVAAAGNVGLTASAGAASMTGQAAASLVATGGVATVRGFAGVYLGGPIFGPDAGPILCAGSLEPFTGLPFGTWGIGAKGHIVGV